MSKAKSHSNYSPEELKAHSSMLSQIGSVFDSDDFPESESTTLEVAQRVKNERDLYRAFIALLGSHPEDASLIVDNLQEGLRK